MNSLIRRTARLREAGPQGIGRGNRLIRRQFSPRSVPGLMGWWDVSQPSSVFQDAAMTTPATADTDPVGALVDLSGNGNHFTQATAGNRPVLKLAAVDGLDALLFTAASSHYLSCNALASVFTGADTPFTAFFHFKLADTTSFSTFGAAGNAGSNTQGVLMRSSNTPLIQFVKIDNTGTTVSRNGATPDTNAHLITYRHTGAAIRARYDEVDTINDTADVGTLTLTTYALGAWPRLSVANFLSGYLRAHALYNRVLSDDEWFAVEAYFAAQVA